MSTPLMAIPEEPEEHFPLQAFVLREQPVILAQAVANAFGVTTSAVNQAARRNPGKFGEAHFFEVTIDERNLLTSQGVMSKWGRGGSRWTPIVYTQKGVVRLATVLSSPRALAATDQIIDIFIEVHRQILAGQKTVTISRPSALLPTEQMPTFLQDIRSRLSHAVTELLETRIDRKSTTTVGDEIASVTNQTIGFVKAQLETKGLQNDKLAADTLLVLEQANEIRERTRNASLKAGAEIERLWIENYEMKIKQIKTLLSLLQELEPSAMVAINQSFLSPVRLESRPAISHDTDRDSRPDAG